MSSEPKLPELPPATYSAVPRYYDGRDLLFTAAQMQVYARAAVEQAKEAPPAAAVGGGSLMDYLKTGKLADKPADSAGVTEAMVEAACLESHQAWDIHWYYSEVWKVAMREKMRRVLSAALSAASPSAGVTEAEVELTAVRMWDSVNPYGLAYAHQTERTKDELRVMARAALSAARGER